MGLGQKFVPDSGDRGPATERGPQQPQVSDHCHADSYLSMYSLSIYVYKYIHVCMFIYSFMICSFVFVFVACAALSTLCIFI